MNSIEKANAAIRLTQNADFIALMAEIEADIFAAFQTTALGDTDALENVHTLSHGHRLIVSRINKYREIAAFEESQKTLDL